MSIARQALKCGLACILPQIRFLVKGPSPSRRTNDGKPIEIALTFDDGPHPKCTPVVLDELSNAGWKGTFFVIGERAAEHPNLLRRIVEEGHAIGNHTYTHSPPRETSSAKFLDEVRRTHDLIYQVTGVSTQFMRPPLGKLSGAKLRGLWKGRQSIILWNSDPKDFAMHNSSDAVAWGESYEPVSGDVVLLHDRLPYAASILRAISQRRGKTVRSVPISSWLPPSTSRDVKIEPAHAAAEGVSG